MKPSETLLGRGAVIRAIVEAHRASNARVFGSVLHGRDTEDSDLDILVDPAPEATMFDIGAIRHELRQLLGVTVDVLTPNGLPDKFRDRGEAGMSADARACPTISAIFLKLSNAFSATTTTWTKSAFPRTT